MPLDPVALRSESFTEVGLLLQRNVDLILERWARRAVEEQPHAQRVHHQVLLNNLHVFLNRLGSSLIESREPENMQHCVAASTHGEQRWEAGWSLPEVVRDYQILRVVVLEFLEESLDRPLGYREVLAVGLALDDAIAASTVMYVKSRDEHLRELEENRAEEARQTQKRLEQQAHALREADRRKNEFLAMLSHELRNPLAPVRNAVNILRLKGPVDPELLWAREVIERQLQTMTRLVEDLLDISRITQGKITLRKERVDLGAVAVRAVEMTRPLLDSRKHLLNVVLPPDKVWLDADPARLIQLFANLLGNAAKYTPEGGEVTLTLAQENGEVVARVRDTGIGIPPEMLPRIFEPFMQEERGLDRAQGGLGIGLALVRTLVELHGGRVEAQSAGRGQGSEFVVRLPLAKDLPVAAVPTAAAASTPVVTRRILVVDDNRDAADSLAMILKISGHQVQTAYNGPSALELAKKAAPDVVLLDLGLPRMDGFEVARRLREDGAANQAFLAAMTGYGQDEDHRKSLQAGFAAHFVKPVDLDELHHFLRHLRSDPSADGTASPR